MTAGDMLTHVHLQDTDGFADRHWAPGEGNMPWAPVFRALGRLNANPRLILELRNHDNVRAGADCISPRLVSPNSSTRRHRRVIRSGLVLEGHAGSVSEPS